MNVQRAKRIVHLLITGKSEIVNGYASGFSLIVLSLIESFLPVSKLPSIPFLQLILGNYLLIVMASMAGGCVLLAKTTILFSASRSYPMVLFSLLSMLGSVLSYAAGLLASGDFTNALKGSPADPAVLLAVSLVLTAVFSLSLTARHMFARKGDSSSAPAVRNRF